MGRSYCFAKSRNIWATTRFVKWFSTAFFYDHEVWLKSVCRAIASRRKSFEDTVASGDTVRGARRRPGRRSLGLMVDAQVAAGAPVPVGTRKTTGVVRGRD